MNDPVVTQILCWVGILLAVVFSAYPLIMKRKTAAPAEASPETAAPAAGFTPPHISADDEKSAQAAALALAPLPLARRVRSFHDLIVANMELLLEVNQWRGQNGVEPRPTYKTPSK